MKYWLAIVSQEHALLAFSSGFLQVCHGKARPLMRAGAHDEFFIYCPKTAMRGGRTLMSIHFHGRFRDDSVYQVEQSPGFCPFRKDVDYDMSFRPVPIRRVAGFSLTARPSWGVMVRRGFLEITPDDASRIIVASGRQQ